MEIIKMIFEEIGWNDFGNGFIWLGIGTSGGLTWKM
jgi:hypothetical protein